MTIINLFSSVYRNYQEKVNIENKENFIIFKLFNLEALSL